jgi:DNA polymerase III delta prime subunit
MNNLIGVFMKPVWAERYRPQSIHDVIFANDRERAQFNAIVQSGDLPSILLTGHQGTGKTSISQALMRDLKVDRTDILKINCSDEQIDSIRDKVKSFAYTMPTGKFRVVRLEEMDWLSQPAQGLLRALIEEVQMSCVFIGTANYKNKIMPPLRSRFQEYDISAPNREDMLVRAAEILEKEGVTFEVDDLDKVIAAAYPDFRKTLHILEAGSKSKTLVLMNAETVHDWKLQLLPLLEAGDFKGARKLVCETANREELQDVYRFLYENIHRVKKLKGKEDQAVVTIAQYQYQHGFVADVEIQVAALFIELGAL